MTEKIKAIVIGASADAVHMIQVAKELGIYVVAMDGNPNAEGFVYADEAINIDISNTDLVFKKADEVKPDFMLPVPIGSLLHVVGAVNEHFGLPGVNFNACRVSTDKFLFHNTLHQAGLRPITCFLVNGTSRYEDMDIVFPVIMKPRYGSGSCGIHIFQEAAELEKYFAEDREWEEDYILEELVDGEEYGMDGAVINGQLEITLLRKKIITPLPARQSVAYTALSKQEYKAVYDRVYRFVNQAAHILEYDECLLHVDLLLKGNDVFIIEMAPRPSGHSIHSCFVPSCTGIDMGKEYIRHLLHKQGVILSGSDVKCQMIRFFDFHEVTIHGVPDKEYITRSGKCNLIRWNCNIREGDYMSAVTDGRSIMGRGYFIIQGLNEKDLLEQSEWILSMFQYS